MLVGILLALASLQFLTIGVLAELVTRTYFESTNRKSYVVREATPPAREREAD